MSEEAAKIDEGVSDWEAGLPSFSDLTPLSQSLIPANLASAFKISPEPTRTALDVNRASQSTISSLRGGAPDDGSDPRKSRRAADPSAELAAMTDNFADDQSMSAAKALKRPRLVWTPQLHKRFVEVVAHLGLRNAVPKTIMQLMNVEGLTRENVASHLQKYRLYVKRMQGSTVNNEGAPTPSDPQSLNKSSSAGPVVNGSVCNGSSGNNRGGIAIPMPPQIMMMGLGYESTQSQLNHNHRHHLHHYQQQYNSMYYGYPHPVAQNNNNKC